MAANLGAMAASHLDASQMTTFKKSVSMLIQPNIKDELKMEALRALTENYELILQSSLFQSFLDHSIKIFCKVLQDDEASFLSETSMQQVSGRMYMSWFPEVIVCTQKQITLSR